MSDSQRFWYIAGTLLFALLIYYISHMLMKRKKSVLMCFLYALICLQASVLIMLAGSYIEDEIVWSLTFLLSSAPAVLYVCIVFDQPAAAKIFLCLTSVLFINTFSSFFLITIPFIPPFAPISYDALFNVAIWLLAFPLLRLLRKPLQEVFEALPGHSFFCLALYPFAASILLSLWRSTLKNLEWTLAFSLLIFVLAGAILLLFGLYQMKEKVMVANNKRIIAILEESERDNYALLNSAIENAAISNHDARHHVRTMQSFMDSEQYEAGKNYLAQLDSHYVGIEIPQICSNIAVDSVLKYYTATCQRNNIQFACKAVIPQKINVADIDICALISNCLENALNAVRKLDKEDNRKITLSAEIVNQILLIKVKNKFKNRAKKNGLGLYSIDRITQKYHGQFTKTIEDNTFEICIMLQQ